VNPALIYLPGFNSGPQSEKSASLMRHFAALEVASYDSWDPDQGHRDLDALMRPLASVAPVLVGSSLGGFWAWHFAAKYRLRCVLLNPCMTPEVTLAPYLGEVQNMYSGAKGLLTRAHLLRYGVYRGGSPLACTVLHEKGDELIPYQESVANFSAPVRLVLVEGGSHRFENLEVAIAEIEAMLASPSPLPVSD
jgi:uncharacterized protein